MSRVAATSAGRRVRAAAQTCIGGCGGRNGGRRGSSAGTVTTDQILIGVGLTLVLAVACQLVGNLLRLPSLILLLPVGFAAGALTNDVNPNALLGAAFQPLVSLSVAVILYDAGLGLDIGRLKGHTRRVVTRLLVIGIPITWGAAAAMVGPLFGMSGGAALMLGAILVVSGPTVVGPLLDFVRPTERPRAVLTWEGSLTDPIGGLLGAVVFHAVSASTKARFGNQVLNFFSGVGVGVLGGAIGAAVLWLVLVLVRPGEILGTLAQLATVVGVAAGCDVIREDSGLIAAIAMGLAVSTVRAFNAPERQPFFEILVQLIIGVLFISISATVTPASLRHLVWPTVGLVAFLVLVVRPFVAYVSTLRTDLSSGERAFIGWMAPRGIVAAATASTFSTTLVNDHVKDADKILPITFLVIVLTVTLYGLTAAPVAKLLGVVRATVSRPLLAGNDPWVVELGRALRSTGVSAVMWTDDADVREEIQQAGLELLPNDLIRATGESAELEGVTMTLLLMNEDGFNALAAAILTGGESGEIYRLGTPADAQGTPPSYAGGEVLFGPHLGRDSLLRRYRSGSALVAGDTDTPVPAGDDLLFRIRADGRVVPVTMTSLPRGEPGDRTILLGSPSASHRGGARDGR